MRPQSSFYPPTNEIFHDPVLLAAEQTELFENGWILVGIDDQLPENESRFIYEAEGRSLLITRDRGARLRAFVNACTHRGTRLCSGAGHGRIQCPYHGWVFGCDGRLLGVSKRSGFPEFDDADYGLRPLAIDRVGRFIFVHGCATPGVSLREYLGSMTGNLEALSASMGVSLFKTEVPIESNWKLAVSGGVEDYHARFVHSDATTAIAIGENTTTLAEHGHSWFRFDVPIPPLLKRLLTFLLGEEPEPVLESHFLFPNITIVRIWSMVKVSNWVPMAPGRTMRRSQMFAPPHSRRRFLPLLATIARRRQGKIMAEDQWIVGEAHLGTRAGVKLLRGPAHREEARVEHLLQEVARRLCRREDAS